MRNIINRYDCDIYGEIPMTENERNYFNEKKFNNKIKFLEFNKKYDINIFRKFILDNGLPKSVFSGSPKRNNDTVKLASMFYNISQSIKSFKKYTKKNNLVYDHVILTRPDLMYEDQPFHLDKIMNSTLNNELYFSLTWMSEPKFPNYCEKQPPRVGEVAHDTYYDKLLHCLTYKKGENGLFNDQFLIGDHKSILKLSSLYDSILPMYKDNIIMDNETMIAIHLIRNKIKVRGVWLNNFKIHRIKRRKKFNSKY
tara:strand:+ start:29201 stop:29962 length:762 start_codon:yes stop_codon:yes gene_type:complete